LAGVMLIDRVTGGVTITVAVPRTTPTVALSVTVPSETPVSTPVMLTVATRGSLTDHKTPVVNGRVVPSPHENMAVAVNICVSPTGTLATAGATTIRLKSPSATVSVAVAEISLKPAVIVAIPPETPRARPVVAFTVATAGALDDHVTIDVTSTVLPSARTAVAVNCWSIPAQMLAVGGVIAIEVK
jgi:hypothetical protein